MTTDNDRLVKLERMAIHPKRLASISDCLHHPPQSIQCAHEAEFCLVLKEYEPNRQDDSDANQENKENQENNENQENAGKLMFLARTCVQEDLGTSCNPGFKGSRGVTVCRKHCR
ncbi:uncharacterized protein LOC111700635 [Eurytemora carolleeae]|uniref:uncharacterized protein LOC111700635 n=1 Tax=Eurytemora carolleeae TaxID=1294199 RepID=UPI000C764766|nr:uncharacterized protein LOC111700635 [Eurytemora carolleeae]|eukprot:XP_023327386.1 uncharacterized protein LOC111700635 [Eurytemora affinis]